MKNNKKYYILYKVIYNELEEINDIQYLEEFNNYQELQEKTHIHKTNIKKMINNSFTNNLHTFKDYCIIKE